MHITTSIDMENPDHEYLIIFNGWGLTIPSPNLVNCVCDAFAALSLTENVLINQSKLTSRNVAKEALSYMMGCCNFTSENHNVDGQKVVISTIINVFFNNKRKISTASVRKDNIASFKKQKRETIFLWYSLIIILYLLSFTLRYLPLDQFWFVKVFIILRWHILQPQSKKGEEISEKFVKKVTSSPPDLAKMYHSYVMPPYKIFWT